jgi:ABC-type Fe3+ transport system permease subunit
MLLLLLFLLCCRRALLEEALQLERQLYVALLAESLSKEEDGGDEAAASDGKASLSKLLKQGPPGDALTWHMCVLLAACCWVNLSGVVLWGCEFVHANRLSKEEDGGEEGAAADGKASLAKLLKQGPPGDALTWHMCVLLAACCWVNLSGVVLWGCEFVHANRLSKEEDGGEEGAAADGKASLAKLLKQGPPGDGLTRCVCVMYADGCCLVEPSCLAVG